MVKKLIETIDPSFTEKNDIYTISSEKDIYLLKSIQIPKEESFSYAFLGGMWYSKDKFSFNNKTISLPYPFSTYYTIKILDKTINNRLYRSTLYIKMPVFVIQFSKHCYIVEFSPIISLNGQDIFPFINLNETKDTYDIRFYLFITYTIKYKEHAWLGKGKKLKINLKIRSGDSFHFVTKTKLDSSWEKAVIIILKKALEKQKIDKLIRTPREVFYHAKDALWRSYDYKRGTFLQLPWRENPGFTFVNSSYSLLSYEAVRLNYFSEWFQSTENNDFALWMKQLHELFLNPAMHTIPKKIGDGIIWYNMTTLTKKGLVGYFYMDTGYSGYPGGQATIDLHLLQYLNRNPDKKLENLVKKSLIYIHSTQNANGSWPMAIKQQGYLKFRPEQLKDYPSFGGTAEASSALLKGASFFNDLKMENAALKGLKFLTDSNPICYNGLRDIGIMEAEAFSAISVINAFLDAFERFQEESYLNLAKTYATYTIPWIYQWNTKFLSFQFNFHPISYSITPRLSPYETAWIISTYHRLSHHIKDPIWARLNIALFNHVTSWISKTGGLSEGVFPSDFSQFQRLPMEQTFATVELMKSADTMMKGKHLIQKKKEKKNNSLDPSYTLRKNQNILSLKTDKKTLFCFDASKVTITKIANTALTNEGISFSFYGWNKKILRRKLKQKIRGNYGKYLIGAVDAKYAITGVKGPKPLKSNQLESISKHVQLSSITIQSKNKAQIICETPVHHIEIIFIFSSLEKSLEILMNITIKIKTHDLSQKQRVLFPVIGAKPVSVSNTSIDFKGFSLKGDLSNIIQTDKVTAIDQTLTTNWTHAGISKKEFSISIPIKEI